MSQDAYVLADVQVKLLLPVCIDDMIVVKAEIVLQRRCRTAQF
jgi:hypothetical protein